MKPVIVWFRQDLRLHDNPAFYEAAQLRLPIIPLYILDDVTPGDWRMGAAQRVWLHDNLSVWMQSLQDMSLTPFLKRGEALSVIQSIVKAISPAAIYWNRCDEPFFVANDNKIRQWLQKEKIETKIFCGHVLRAPETLLNQSNEHFKVFTAFWRAHQAKYSPRKIYPKPTRVICFDKPINFSSERLDNWHLLPTSPDWSVSIRRCWMAGEVAAKQRLSQWLTHSANDYEKMRDFPEKNSTSRLSPYLHFGNISSHQVYHAILSARTMGKLNHIAAQKFLAELGWREFSNYLIYHFPQLPEKNFKANFDTFPWGNDSTQLNRWQRGLTGYPIVDAGMRELWHTGYMHNRVRMIVASFLIKDLLIDWRLGARWFWDTLVDADLANNAASWQWVAGCGADAAPYFRIFNPTRQGEKFDPQGLYVKRWLPVLAELPMDYVHQPWAFLGGKPLDYPPPIVIHEEARLRALSLVSRVNIPKRV